MNLQHKFQETAILEKDLRSWLNLRQELIVQFNQLCHFRPFTQTQDLPPLEENLWAFCQILLDYVSIGQFDMFEKLIRHIEKNHHAYKLPKTLLQDLRQTALIALDFNDRYTHLFSRKTLDKDLSYLAEHLAYRFDWEDDLIALYRT